MRAGVLTHESVVRLLNEAFIPVMADAGSSAETKRACARYGYRGMVPFLVLLSPDGERLQQIMSPHGLLAELRDARERDPRWSPPAEGSAAHRAAAAFARADWKQAARRADEALGQQRTAAMVLLAARARIHAMPVPDEDQLLARQFFSVREQGQSGELKRAEELLAMLKQERYADTVAVERARLALIRKQRARAAGILKSAIKRFPRSAHRGEMYYWLGLVRFAEGRKAGALATWQRGREAAPDSLWSLRSKLLTIGGMALR